MVEALKKADVLMREVRALTEMLYEPNVHIQLARDL